MVANMVLEAKEERATVILAALETITMGLVTVVIDMIIAPKTLTAIAVATISVASGSRTTEIISPAPPDNHSRDLHLEVEVLAAVVVMVVLADPVVVSAEEDRIMNQ